MNENEFADKTKEILHCIGTEESNRLFSYEHCELELSFVAFIQNYENLKESIPKDFAIIDIGSYQSFQADYFKDHERYIGVEPAVPLEFRLRQDNAKYYEQSAQQFVMKTLPKLIEEGFELNKTFVICSAVPDEEVQNLVIKTFPYHRVAYPAQKTIESFPKHENQKNKNQDIER